VANATQPTNGNPAREAVRSIGFAARTKAALLTTIDHEHIPPEQPESLRSLGARGRSQQAIGGSRETPFDSGPRYWKQPIRRFERRLAQR
jgi:hypothetical protein